MTRISATDAKNRFGQVLDLARKEPVFVHKNGREVAVVLSRQAFEELQARAQQPQVRPAIEELLQRSLRRRASLYEALAR